MVGVVAQVTNISVFLDNILLGNLNLADRGFDIKNIDGEIQCKMEMPVFTKGKNQIMWKG